MVNTGALIEAGGAGNTWEGTWEDRETGKSMAGRVVEVWTMRDGMIAVWDAAFNIWEHGGERKSTVM